MENVYIALIINITTGYDLSQFNLVIELFNSQYPNNKLVYDEYLVDGTVEQTIQALTNFLQKYPYGKRVTVSATSSVITQLSNYTTNNNIDIIHLSLNATSNYLQKYNNVLTYAPFNQFSVMSIFMTYVDYQMNEVCVLYQKNTANDLFYNDYLNQLNKQAILLNIKVTLRTLEPYQYNYNIKPKSLIVMLGVTKDITDLYVTPAFLCNIPKQCYIMLTDINSSITDIFGQVPAIVANPTPLNYTITTQLVYNAVKNNPNGYDYSSYAFYDILIVLRDFTINNLPITIQNYVFVTPSDDISPAWLLNSNLNPLISGSPYGNFGFIFTKNIIIGNDDQLFLQYYQGGQVVLPNSYSLFRIIGITFNNESLINYDESEYYKIYDRFNNKIVVRFNSDITAWPPIVNNEYLNIGTTIDTKFIYQYNPDGYFIVLERLFPCNGKIPEVNPTMSKVPIKLRYF